MPIMSFMTRYYHSSQSNCRFNSVSHQIINVFRLTLFSLVACFVTSCEEGPTKIGNELLPGSDFVNIKSIDTLSVWSYTMYDDSVRTDNPSVSYIGQIYDPYFGTTTAGLVSEIRMGGKWIVQPFTIDSVKLALHFLSTIGDGSSGTHTLKISEIAEQLHTDQAYYSNTPVPLTGFVVDNIELPVLKTDTIVFLKLPGDGVEFGNYLTRDTSKLFYSNTKPDFRAFFNGLYFEMNEGSERMLTSLSLVTDATGFYNNYFVLYMHNDTGVSSQFFFVLDATNPNASFNKFSHDFNTALPGKKIEHINDFYRDTLSYLQYLNGVYTRVVLPGLAGLKNDPDLKHIAVNKARLTVPVYFDGDLYKPSTVPAQLYLRYRTKSGDKYIVPDYNIDQYHAFFDGTLDSTANNYKFNLAAYVQSYLKDSSGEIEPELELFQGTGTRNLILKANNSKTPVKFDFVYTEF